MGIKLIPISSGGIEEDSRNGKYEIPYKKPSYFSKDSAIRNGQTVFEIYENIRSGIYERRDSYSLPKGVAYRDSSAVVDSYKSIA